MKKILLTGGGTAGHVTPHLALLPLLKDYDIYYIGSKNGIEKTIIEKENIPYKAISVGKLRRYFSVENFKDIFKVMLGTIQATLYLFKLKPDIVFSKGGFVAVPVVIAAKINRVPIICHESDITPGIATKISAKFAKKVCTTFESCVRFFDSKGVYTGTPLRESLFNGDANKARQVYGFDDKPVLLIMGGSQGALAVNNAIRSILDKLCEKFNIIHLCGAGKKIAELDNASYKQVEYLNEELADAISLADIVVSRSGSNSIMELQALKKPMLLIPLPQSGVSRGDQVLNAKDFMSKGIAQMLMQDEITPEKLYNEIIKLYEDREKIKNNFEIYPAKNGAEIIAQMIKENIKSTK